MPPVRSADQAVRRFGCSYQGCSAAFIKRAHLRRHEMTHTQRRDFVCPGCGRPFSRNDSMARHLRRKHPDLSQEQARPIVRHPPAAPVFTFPLAGGSMQREPDTYLRAPEAYERETFTYDQEAYDQSVFEQDTYEHGTYGRETDVYGRAQPALLPQLETWPLPPAPPQFLREPQLGVEPGVSLPSFRHPWQLRPTAGRAPDPPEASALSPASSSIRIGGQRYTPVGDRGERSFAPLYREW